MAKRDLTTAPEGAVEAFLDKVAQIPARPEGRRGRLIFALDATASREPTWDRASDVQAQMFLEAEALGGLDVQLVFYRGFQECRASRWVDRPSELVRLMTGVMCRAGQTQIRRVLRHARKEAERTPVQALVFIGDCAEEGVDELAHAAGEIGLLGVRAFMFQEGGDALAERAFREVAGLTGGAYCQFDRSSPAELRALLGAVARYAAGGRNALLTSRSSGVAKLLASQVR